MKHVLRKIALAATTALTCVTPALAQEAAAGKGDDIIVTARRVEERLQDVPISITVYNPEQLADRNIVVATDLATYTPSLSVNQRYGPEKASFAIRGFNQDQNTAPTVGVYFADVVGVRAQGGTTSGNTVGAGAFSDLQSVQVLKGPQGTLFGRNTTGGAVLLVPQKPTDKLEGYVEGSLGNYNMWRMQAAINVPLAETFKVRVSVDRNQRDGYMKNHSGTGASDFNDVNYMYARLSIVADLTPDLENYTIFHYSDSDTNGYAARMRLCDTVPITFPGQPGYANYKDPTNAAFSYTRVQTGQAACGQISRQTARGDRLRDVEVNNPDPFLHLRQWQVINTTTWQASDALTVKNIISYGEFRESTSFSLNSDNFFVPAQPFPLPPLATQGQPFQHILLDTSPNENNSSQSTMTEELQLQGRTADGKFNWVAGGYLEFSRPIGWSAGRTSIFGNCTDTENLVCTQPLGFGIISASRTKLSFDNHGIFGQGTYRFSDQFSITAGARYTFDKITGESESTRITMLPSGFRILSCNDPRANGGKPPSDQSQCHVETGTTFANGTEIAQPKSNKPTWLIDFDYKPSEDWLLYAKWSRGYRQGGLTFTNPGLESWDPEKVEAYEVGAKTSFGGSVHGYFNIAGFYNDFSNQQVFGSLIAKPTSGLAGGAAIINAGKSEIYGIELESSVTLFDSLRFDGGYTYLHTKIKELVPPTLDPDSPFSTVIPSGVEGDPLALSPKHKLTMTATYTLPLDESDGELSAGVTYTYTSSMGSPVATPLGGFPSTNLFNLNLTWNRVMGSPVDFALFASNVTNDIYPVGFGGGYTSGGYENTLIGQPRMYGARLRFNFGN